MLRPVLFVCLTALGTAAIPVSAQQMEDVVRLRDGGVIRGTIIEHIPGESLKILAPDGEVFVYTVDEIAEIARGPSPGAGAPPSQAVCVIGEHSGFPEADARTAALLVCGELRKQGLPVGDPVSRAPDGADRYRLDLHRLGQYIVVRLSHVDPGGRVIIERQIQMGGIEEMISAAPRLAEAVVLGRSVASTVDRETVVEEEARRHRLIPGDSFWGVGLMGTIASGIAKPGYSIQGWYETGPYAVGSELWGSGGEDDEGDSFLFVAWGIGGRYYFGKGNVSPYLGGGFTRVWSSYEQLLDSLADDEEGGGLGGYIAGGLEALRFTRARLRLELRVDRPFFGLGERDMMPVSLGLSLTFPAPRR